MTVKLESDQQHRLPEMMRRQRFYHAFTYYWNTLRVFGLRSDMTEPDLQECFRKDRRAREAALTQWRGTGGVVPSPLVWTDGVCRVSGDYICLGHYLFEPPLDSDEGLEEARNRFNAAAGRQLPPMLRSMAESDRLPGAVRQLLAGYAGRLSAVSWPEGEKDEVEG